MQHFVEVLLHGFRLPRHQVELQFSQSDPLSVAESDFPPYLPLRPRASDGIGKSQRTLRNGVARLFTEESFDRVPVQGPKSPVRIKRAEALSEIEFQHGKVFPAEQLIREREARQHNAVLWNAVGLQPLSRPAAGDRK